MFGGGGDRDVVFEDVEFTATMSHVASDTLPSSEHVTSPDTVYPSSQSGVHPPPGPRVDKQTPREPCSGAIMTQFAGGVDGGGGDANDSPDTSTGVVLEV